MFYLNITLRLSCFLVYIINQGTIKALPAFAILVYEISRTFFQMASFTIVYIIESEARGTKSKLKLVSTHFHMKVLFILVKNTRSMALQLILKGSQSEPSFRFRVNTLTKHL
jgi:hypothetical protein